MIILGLDGATFSLVRPWVEAGELPAFERLLEESASGPLESTEPPVTIPAWLTFATSRSPEDLGMYGFTHLDRETKKTELTHDEFVRGKLWDSVDDQGGRSVVFNVPGSYPWRELDGTIVAAAPEYKSDYSHPPERWEEVDDLVDGYKLRVDAEAGSREYVRQALSLADKRFRAFDYLIEDERPDLAVGLIRATDRVAHYYWDESIHEDNDLLAVYRTVDERLGEFLDAHPDENVVVMSDHGFERIESHLSLNHVLATEGYVTLADDGDSTKALLGQLRGAASTVLSKVGLLSFARRLVPEDALSDIPYGDTLGLGNAIALGRIDWERTRAVADSGGKTGLVYLTDDDVDVDAVRRALTSACDSLGVDVRVTEPDESGRTIPDLKLTVLTEGVYVSSRFDVDEPLFDVDTSGHGMDGIFVARGPAFREGTIQGANIRDVAPTVLHAMGLQIPDTMGGNVLDVFADDHEAADRDPSYYEFVERDVVAEEGVSGDAEREDEVKDRLQELGYLE